MSNVKGGGVRTLLVVDDEPEVLEIVEAAVKDLGYKVLMASNAEDVFKILDTHDVYGVLADIHMPEMDGIQLLGKLRAKGSDLPFVFFTGFGSVDRVIDAVCLGSVDFIRKPCEVEHFKGVIERMLEIGNRRRDIERSLQNIRARWPEAAQELDSIDRNKAQIQRLRALSLASKK